jgi:micrococcal nuclease
VVVALVTASVLASVACAGAGTGGSGPDDPSADRGPSVAVTDVVDGDTIRVALDGADVTVRLIGIDTPEREGPYTDEECFGRAASRYTAEALDGRRVVLEFDVEATDRFGRTLAYVWLDGAMFNEAILRDGYAVLATFPPNVRYVERLGEAQARARDERAGLWGACPG